MSTLGFEDEAMQVDTVDCSETELTVRLKDGRRISVPLWWLPRLVEATPQQRAGWRIMPFGDAIEWPEVDEHVSVKGLLRGKPAPGAKPPRRTGRRTGWTSHALQFLPKVAISPGQSPPGPFDQSATEP